MLFSVFRLKVVPACVEDYGNPPSVGGVAINLVGAVPAIKDKPVAVQRRNDFASGKVPKLSVVDAHGSESHCNARFDGNLYLVAWFVRDVLAVLKHAVNYHVDKVVDALEGFGLRFAPRRRPVPFEGWAIGMPAGRIPIEILISLHDDFEGVGFHENYFARLLSRMRETNLHLSGQAFAERIITVSH